MKLAKQHIDVGLYTNSATAMLEFWQQRVGLPYEETLPLGGGVRQHRHAMNGSVLKINDARGPLPDEGLAGYREIIIARDGIAAPESLTDPDGNRVTLVPPGFAVSADSGRVGEITGIGVRLGVRDEAAFHRFYGEALQLEAAGERAYRCGDSLLLFARDAHAGAVGRMQARGLRYMTVQVWDVDADHAGIVARGGAEGRAPLTLGSTARISFVRDPDGNWIEVSQRASLTGPLPG